MPKKDDDRAMLRSKAIEMVTDGEGLKERGQYREAVKVFEGSLALMTEAKASPEDRARVLADLAHANLRLGNIDRSVAFASEAMGLISGPGASAGLKGEVTFQYGIAIYARGDLPESLKNLERALSLFEAAKDRVGVAKTCRNIGNVYSSKVLYGKALAYYNRALKMHEELGRDRDRWYTFYNIALIKRMQGLYQDSQKDFESAMDFFTRTKDALMMARVLTNLGQILLKIGRWGEAIARFEESAKVCKTTGQEGPAAQNIISWAEALLGKGDVKGARELISSNVDSIIGSDVKEIEADALRVRAMVLREEGELGKAEEDLALAETVLSGSGFEMELALVYIEWAKTALAAKDRFKAKRMFGKAKAIYMEFKLPIKERDLDIVIKGHGL